MPEKREDPDWKTQTPAQRLSSRTILRFQSLADELKNDLGRILGDSIKGLYFVSADRNNPSFIKKTPIKSYYNLRLLSTYQFTAKNNHLWNWIHNSITDDQDTVDTWGKNRAAFELLFKEAAETVPANRFEDFCRQVMAGKKEAAHDLLINTLASLSYTGALPSAFDNFVAECSSKKSDNEKSLLPERFKYENKHVYFPGPLLMATESTGELDKDEPPVIEFGSLEPAEQLSLRSLSERFINPFCLGQEFHKGAGWEYPYGEPKLSLPLSGLFVPVYDFNDENGQPAGGFEGWLMIVESDEEKKSTEGEPENSPGNISNSYYALLSRAIAIAVQGFASRVSEERMRELLEMEWADSDSPENFTRKNYKHYGGFSGVSLSNADRAKLKFEVGERYQWLDLDNDLEKVTDVDHINHINRINHIAVKVSGSGASEIIIVFRKRHDTKLPKHHEYLKNYGYQIARSVKILYDFATIAETEKRKKVQSGLLASAHDYSKDIGSACLRLQEFAKDLEGGQRAILERSRQLAELPAPAPAIGEQISHELTRCFQPPSMDWFSAVQFTHAHLKTQTYGPITGEPIECVAMVETGTLRSIYSLVRSLVWMPLHYVGYKELEQDLQAAKSPEIDNPLTWAALFRYDMRPTEATGSFHQMLGDRIIQIIRKENIEGSDFLNRFPAPEINPEDNEFDVPLLWSDAEPASRYSPIERLLPLLVFSLRFAYQCAWAKTLLAQASGSYESINISARNTDTRTRRIEITFSAPVSSHQGRMENIPYYLEWRQQMSHYTGRAYPWRDVGTDSVTLDSQKHRITLALTASI